MTEQQMPTPPPVPEDEAPPKVVDYFGFKAQHKHYLPDGTQYFEFEAMNEGMKSRYQSSTTRDFVVDRRTGDTKVSVDPGTERRILIELSVTGWHLMRGGVPIPFSKVQLGDFLTLADPVIVEGLEKAIRDANPWLLDDVTPEAIQEQIDELTKQKQTLEERRRGEAS